MRNTAVVYVAGTLIALGAMAPAHAQYVNPYTHNNFNNPNSSLIDTTLMGLRNQMMLNSTLNSSHASDAALRAAYNKQMAAGQRVIKSGKATTHFTPRTLPADYWTKRTGGTTPEKYKQYAGELAQQQNIWAQEVRARSVDTGDMAQVLGLSFVLAWEAHSGSKATAAQYQGITKDFRDMLLKNPLYQGLTMTGKQMYFESNMVNATDPVRLLREATRTNDDTTFIRARTGGRSYVNSWLPSGYTRYEATPTGFKETK